MPTIKSRLLSTASNDRTTTNRQSVKSSHGDGSTSRLSTLRLQSACIVATLTAAIIFTLTEHDDHQHTWWCAFEIVMQILLVIVGTAFFRTRLRLLRDSSVIMPLLVMVVTLSLLCEPIQRLLLGHGHAFEILVMHSQSNLMLALTVCGFRLRFQRLAMLLSVFLTIFSCTISNANGLIPLTLFFCVACVTWLVLSWWETVDCRLVEHNRRRRPVLWMAGCVVVGMMLLLPSLGFGNNTLTTALKGFMPSSGGSGSFDPFSRGGVNDGDALVAGNENIKSFAPLDDAPFLDSDKPSLYDVFNDQFDEPPKKIKDQERAVALPADLMKHVHQKMAEAKQAGREFSLIRDERVADRRMIRDLDSPAAFYVAGRVPARFRMEVYEYFDGVTWYPLDGERPDLSGLSARQKMREVEGRHWLEIPSSCHAFEIDEGSATHSVKIANLDGNVIPSPPQLVGVSIGQVDRKDMYTVSRHGIAGLQRKSIPEMTPINMISEYVSRSRLANCSTIGLASPTSKITRALPNNATSDAVRKLAEQWTAGLPRGWQQIAAIESRLREHCVLDREAKASSSSESPVADFLLNTRRGPEYLFAASAACLLRSLDYPARLVSGFYADPENYDARKQHTAVFAHNAHFWCEVGIGIDTWITIEASPGYAIAQPPPGLLTRLWNAITAVGLLAVDNVVPLLLAIAVLTLLFVNRSFVVDAVLTLRWKMASALPPDQRALQLATLIENRMKLARLSRDSCTTLKRWTRRKSFSPVRQELARVADIADQAMFGDGTLNLSDHKELDCLATFLSYRRLRTLHQQQLREGDSSGSVTNLEAVCA